MPSFDKSSNWYVGFCAAVRWASYDNPEYQELAVGVPRCRCGLFWSNSLCPGQEKRTMREPEVKIAISGGEIPRNRGFLASVLQEPN